MQSKPIEIEDIVQNCLELIQSGQETIDSVLDYYPELAETLRPELEVALWIYSRNEIFNPRPGFVPASKRRLVEKINQEARAAPLQKIGMKWGSLNFLWSRKLALQSAFILLFILSIFIGSNRAVIAARNTIPGDPLYPVKIAQEQFKLAVTFTAYGDTRLRSEYALRRLVEIQEIILEGRYEYVHDTVEDYENQVEQAVRLLNKVVDRDRLGAETLATDLEGVLSEQVMLLAILSESVPANTKQELRWAMNISEGGVNSAQQVLLAVIALTTPVPTVPGSVTAGAGTGGATQTSTPGLPLVLDTTPTTTHVVGATPTLAPSKTATPTKTPTRTVTPFVTRTAEPDENILPTSAPTLTPPGPGIPTSAPTATSTASTILPTGIPTDIPTATTTPPVDNTPTSTATSPSPSTPTATQTVPPSPTPTSSPSATPAPTQVPACAVGGSFDIVYGNKLDLTLTNYGSTGVRVDRVVLEWPTDYNETLKEIKMGGDLVWNEGSSTSPTEISSWIGAAEQRQINAAGWKIMEFVFKISVVKSSGYTVTVYFDNGCSATALR